MRKKRQYPRVVVLRHVWPALVFVAIWLQFPHVRNSLTVSIYHVYCLLALIGLAVIYRMRVAQKKPGARVLKYTPAFDAVVLALAIRFTGGVQSDLWLFYYFLLASAAMEPGERTIGAMSALVSISYIAGTLPDITRLDWGAAHVMITRLFFLLLTGVLVREVARSRNSLSEELSKLSEQLSLSQERNRIARELHDGMGHSLVNCILTLELCERLVCKDPNEAGKIITQEKEDLRAVLDDVRDYVHQLRPAEIENEPFVPLVKRYLTRFAERTSVKARLQVQTPGIDLLPSGRLLLLRILQEALTNAAKHSQATEVNVSLARTADRGVHCVIADNGSGFDEEEVLSDSASRRGFGLRTMKDRAKSAGGDAQIESKKGKGTRVSVYVPG